MHLVKRQFIRFDWFNLARRHKMAKALIVVDVIKDFMEEDGALFVGGQAQNIVSPIVDTLEEMKGTEDLMVFACDSHDVDDAEFKVYGPHAIKGTEGAELIDACIRGFGAGAGNAQLEMLIPVLEKSGFELGINFESTIKEADKVMDYLVPAQPISTPINILTGLKKLFSCFEKPIIKASKLYGIEYSSLIFELGNRKLVAGQEDLILEVAEKLKNKLKNK